MFKRKRLCPKCNGVMVRKRLHLSENDKGKKVWLCTECKSAIISLK